MLLNSQVNCITVKFNRLGKYWTKERTCVGEDPICGLCQLENDIMAVTENKSLAAVFV